MQTAAAQASGAIGMQPPTMAQKKKSSKGLKAFLIVLIILCIIVGLGVIGYGFWQDSQVQQRVEETEGVGLIETVAEPVMEEPPVVQAPLHDPIDFAALQAENPEIYAWLYVPGTNIDFPVEQSDTDDAFYLSHDEYGNYDINGAIYSEQVNDKDFTDPVTLLYGHTMINEAVVFGTLHYFEDAAFFDEHPNMYIFTPTETLTYEIVSAMMYDNRHIMKSFDFEDINEVQDFFDFIIDPEPYTYNVRSMDSLKASSDHILLLSTCPINGAPENRFIVTGVLADKQPADSGARTSSSSSASSSSSGSSSSSSSSSRTAS